MVWWGSGCVCPEVEIALTSTAWDCIQQEKSMLQPLLSLSRWNSVFLVQPHYSLHSTITVPITHLKEEQLCSHWEVEALTFLPTLESCPRWDCTHQRCKKNWCHVEFSQNCGSAIAITITWETVCIRQAWRQHSFESSPFLNWKRNKRRRKPCLSTI